MKPANRREPVPVGVTGHRVLADVERVMAGIDEALGRLGQAFPGRGLAVVSALAEGADRLVARGGVSRQATLIAVLPLPRDEYEKDFLSQSSRDEFRQLLAQAATIVEPPHVLPRDEAYEQVGQAVLDRCEALIAVWDGQASQGRGGTAEIVARARARQMPIAWVRAGNRRPGTMQATSLGSMQGTVICERLPQPGGTGKKSP